MKLNTITTNIAVCALALGIGGTAFARPAAEKKASDQTGTTTTASSNILPFVAVSPSFYVIGVPMAPDPVEPNAQPESRPAYSIVPKTPTLNIATPYPGSTEPGSLDAAIQIEPEYAVLNRLISYAGLVPVLSKVSHYTLLAPTNSAFAKISQDQIDTWMLPENHDKLRMMLKSHIIVGDMTAAQLGGESQLKTLEGNWLPVSNANGAVTVGTAKIVKADVTCANGTIHTVDTVLTM